MALSEAEEKWLEDRDAIQFATGEYLCGLYPEMLVDDFRDAAEFEARVAAKLAKYCADYWQRESAWHALKDARIEVEQEF